MKSSHQPASTDLGTYTVVLVDPEVPARPVNHVQVGTTRQTPAL